MLRVGYLAQAHRRHCMPEPMARALPRYEFSLEGGPPEIGWKRVNITMDHPLFKNLSLHLKERALTSKTTVNVDVDSALWGFRPESQEKHLERAPTLNGGRCGESVQQ